ncbi:MAG: Ig-like domain-containing protein [bacterium]|nr:Ig-like domain-containing protein [bacterium]
MDVMISGTAKLEAQGANAEAVYEGIHEKGSASSASELKKFAVSGGTFISSGSALSFTKAVSGDITITGGTYSSDPSGYVSAPYVVKQTEGKYTVVLAGVAVTPATAELVLGLTSSATLKASSDIQEETFTWKTSDKEVVTVDGDGTIRAVSEGKAVVTATGSVSKLSASCEVTVRAADDVVVTPAKLELAVGGSAKVTAKYDQADVISWKSNDAGIATVSTDGTVKALKAGIAVITATGKVNAAGCVVTVTDPDVPAPTPTPQPVSPATVDKEENPVNNDSGKPENVEAAAFTLYGTNDCTKEEVASTTGFKEEDLVANAEGDLTVNPVIAKKAIEGVMSADSTVTPKNITLLPIVKATVDTDKNVAAIALILPGAELGAQDGTVVGDINLIKVFADGTGAKFGYAAAASEYGDKMFALKDAAGKNLTATDKVAADKEYMVIAFVADNGDFDLDATPSNVIDPIAVATNAATPAPSGGGSGGGCNGGFGLLALLGLALVPALYGKKK